MTTPTDNAASVFDAFGQAYEALKRVPELETTIRSQAYDIQTLEELMDLYKAEVEQTKNERDALADQKRSTEEALEKARKSQSELATRLDLVVGALNSIGSNIGATLSVVAPEPIPEAVGNTEAVVSVSTDPTSSADATAASPSSIATAEMPVPKNSYEADYRDRGVGWEDTNGVWHVPASEGVSVSSDPMTATSSAPVAGPFTSAPTPSVTTSETETEVTATPSVPFAQSTESPSATVASTTSAAPPAPSSDTASNDPDKLPDWLYRPHSY